jgi:Icc protein
MKPLLDRRAFLKNGGAAALAASLPVALVEFAFAKETDNFAIAYISDAHIQNIKGSEFVRNWDRGLIRAVAETNLLNPAPDFVVFGGDLAHLGTKAELDRGAEILAALHPKAHHVTGESDYYLDLGDYWSRLFGPQWYSFDHKGVHFVVLNSILTYEDWTSKRWPTAEQRMQEMALLDNPNGSPFMVGEKQRAWLADDLKKVRRNTPVVVFSHSPLQKIYKLWNFWTEDADEVQALLKPFDKVTVIYGHVHQIQYNQIGNVSFHSVMSTAWPFPYPQSYARTPSYLPKLTVPMNRADPFFERDGTGWQFVNLATGKADIYYNLYNNAPRNVAFNPATGQPEDTTYQASDTHVAPQQQY